MGRNLYSGLLLMIGVVILSGCKIFRQKNRVTEQSERAVWQQKSSTQTDYRLLQDSLSRYWLFWSDSSFRFHPDSGLVANTGTILMQDARVRKDMLNKTAATISDVGTQVREITKKEKNGLVIRPPYLWLIALTLCGVIVLWKLSVFFRYILKR